MSSRLKLHEELCEILGSRNVYFQPPESVKMKYPCIRYSLSDIRQLKADDKQYRSTNGYDIVVIEIDPDSTIHSQIMAKYPMCTFISGYVADNLNHKKLKLYY